jgi:glycosyltransferase involved in cell wall biosynthesis
MYNAGDLIFSALNSLINQTFTDFEIVIVDNNSNDGSYERVRNYLEKTKLSYFIYKNDTTIPMVRNWNRPIEYANGKYIATLHHDDSFKPSHLENAHMILSKDQNIGLYAVGNQNRKRILTGEIKPEIVFQNLYKVIDVPPPSEAIFKKEYKGNRYFYNDRDYIYGADMELYLDILDDGLKFYYSDNQTVIRGPIDKTVESITKGINYTWKKYTDRFKLIEKYKGHRLNNENLYHEAINYQINIVFLSYIKSRKTKLGTPEELFKNAVKIIVENNFYKKFFNFYFWKTYLDILDKKLLRILINFSKELIKKLIISRKY